MKRAGRVCRVAASGLRARALVAFRLRSASRSLPSWSALRLRAARPRRWSVRASRRRPTVRAPASSIWRPRPRVVVVLGPSRRARAAGSFVASARARRLLGRVAWWGLGVSFLKRSLRATPAPSAISNGLGPLSRSLLFCARDTALGFATPASLGERRTPLRAILAGWEPVGRNGIS